MRTRFGECTGHAATLTGGAGPRPRGRTAPPGSPAAGAPRQPVLATGGPFLAPRSWERRFKSLRPATAPPGLISSSLLCCFERATSFSLFLCVLVFSLESEHLKTMTWPLWKPSRVPRLFLLLEATAAFQRLPSVTLAKAALVSVGRRARDASYSAASLPLPCTFDVPAKQLRRLWTARLRP